MKSSELLYKRIKVGKTLQCQIQTQPENMCNKSNFLLFFYVNTPNFQGTPEILTEFVREKNNMHIPLVCIQKERLCPSRDRIQDYDLRRAVWCLSFSCVHHTCFQICLLRNSEGTEPVLKGMDQTRKTHHRWEQ